ncbi:hypothetical protein [Endozoicomonas sp. 4G]|uniref:hypothetical protein n=1 Tax=Endozoicomonas sp. 4G TaxID=2872754 RepID=UPI0020789C8A|nr:hypothetical protein [Endozoicomonas sp. 4G]
MTTARPHALSLAVTLAISSSIIGTQALADTIGMANRRLQIRSVDPANGRTEFIRSEVMVKPTLDDNQQPIPKSFTTTYPDQAQTRTGHKAPSPSFTNVLSGIDGGVSTVDLFETDDNGFAQKYVKVLKVGNEGIFRFTHNLAEKELFIEVRDGMTHENTIDTVSAQLLAVDIEPFDPFDPLTKIAGPEQLAALLKGAHQKAGSLGDADDYIPLANIDVEPVDVKKRTFMRLIAAADYPPALQRLGQSIFVNDEVLFAAATSAYAKVHIEGEGIQQEALNHLFMDDKPVGYVEYVKDNTQAHPAPEGYPKLEVYEAPGDTIVFHSQKPNPSDTSFVEGLYYLWQMYERNENADETEAQDKAETEVLSQAQVKTEKVKSYQYVLQSTQMRLLENLAAELAADPEKLNHNHMRMLADYEVLQWALSSATQDGADEFQFTVKQMQVAESLVSAPWIRDQLAKRFSFKPAFINLLNDERFIKAFLPSFGSPMVDAFSSDEAFAIKMVQDMASQKSDENVQQHAQRREPENPKIWLQKLNKEINRIPGLEKRVHEVEKRVHEVEIDTTLAHNAKMAAVLGIKDWDNSKSLTEQDRLLREQALKIQQTNAAIDQTDAEMTEAGSVAIGSKRDITLVNEDDLEVLQSIQQQLQQITGQPDEVVREKLSTIEGHFSIVPHDENDLAARHLAVRQHLKLQIGEIRQRHTDHHQEVEKQGNRLKQIQDEVDLIPIIMEQKADQEARAEARRSMNKKLAKDLSIYDWDSSQPLAKQDEIIDARIKEFRQSPAARSMIATPSIRPLISATSIAPTSIAPTSIAPTSIAATSIIARSIAPTPVTATPVATKSVATKDTPTGTATGNSEEEAVKGTLAHYEKKFGLVTDNENDLSARYQLIQQHLQDNQKPKSIQNTLTKIEAKLGLPSGKKNPEDTRHKAISEHLKAQKELFDQARQKLAAEDDRHEELLQKVETLKYENPSEGSATDGATDGVTDGATDGATDGKEEYSKGSATDGKKDAPTVTPENELAEIPTQEQYSLMSLKLTGKIIRIAKLEEELDDIRTPGHPKAMPDVLETISDVERALEMTDLNENDDIYLRRDHISEDMQEFIREARERVEEGALEILESTEEILSIEVNEEDEKATRFSKVLEIIDRGDLPNDKIEETDNAIWAVWVDKDAGLDDKNPKLMKLIAHLHYKIEGSDLHQQTPEQQTALMKAAAEILDIEFSQNDDAAARFAQLLTTVKSYDVPEYALDQVYQGLWEKDSKALSEQDLKLRQLRASLIYTVDDSFLDKQAREEQTRMLDAIESALEIEASDNRATKERGQASAYKPSDELEMEFEEGSLTDQKKVLTAKVDALMDKADKTNYDDATLVDQNRKIKAKLKQLHKDIANMGGKPDVNERIAAIEKALDREMAHLGLKPRYAYDRKLARTRQDLEYAEKELSAANHKLNKLSRKQLPFLIRSDNQQTDLESMNQEVKKVQTDLGLPAGDEQTCQERIDDIKQYLQEKAPERTDEIYEKLEAAAKAHNILTDSNQGSLEKDDDSNALENLEGRPGLEASPEPDGELTLARKNYAQVTSFLHEHDRKNIEAENARLAETSAQNDLSKQQEVEGAEGFENLDDKTQTLHKEEIIKLTTALEEKKEATLKAEKALADYHEAALEATEKAMGLTDVADTNEDRINTLRNRRMQLGGNDGAGGKILQLTRKQDRLKDEIATKRAHIERLKQVIQAEEQAIENEGGTFQYTPSQKKIRTEMLAFTQSHPLKEQALEAAMALTEMAVESDKAASFIDALDFDNEFAPIRLVEMTGDKLAFDQAGGIVEIFKRLKALPEYPVEPVEDQPMNALGEVLDLVRRARNEMRNGPQEYDEDIRNMGLRVIHYVSHEPGDLNSFSEYFASHSASGNKIIHLLHEGLISKVELENYMNAVRGVAGYEIVKEFEHFLDNKHGIDTPKFKEVVQKLSDKAAENFMQSAFAPVTVTDTGPTGMKESVAGMKEYSAAVIANYILDDIAFEDGRKTTAFLTNIKDTLTPYANAAGLTETTFLEVINDTLMLAHAAAVEYQLHEYWLKPSASLVQAATWYFTNYRPLLATRNALEASKQSLVNMALLYLLDLTNRGDYTHRMLTPFQHWLERYGFDLDRTGQYRYHRAIERFTEVAGLAMPFGKAASSVILLETGSSLFARQYNANPHMYRSIYRLVPEIVKSMSSRQGVQIPLLHQVTPQKVKTLASATASLVLGPVTTVGAYTHGFLSGLTYAQTFGFALASTLSFDFFMNDNKMLTQWLGGPLGRSLDKINRWRGVGEKRGAYKKRTAITSPQRFNETDEEYASRVKANDMMYGWTRHENYLHFRERRDRTMKLYKHGWEKYFKENVPKWSFSHANSLPYSYTLGALYGSQAKD